jgi:hypothetical protein
VSYQSDWTRHLYHLAFLASSTLYHKKHGVFPQADISETGKQIRFNPSHNHFKNNNMISDHFSDISTKNCQRVEVYEKMQCKA